MHNESDTDTEAEVPYQPKLSGFVAVGFLFALFLGVYPMLSSLIAESNPNFPLILLVALPFVMSVILVPLFGRLQTPEPH